jgi:hypothetical protein
VGTTWHAQTLTLDYCVQLVDVGLKFFQLSRRGGARGDYFHESLELRVLRGALGEHLDDGIL